MVSTLMARGFAVLLLGVFFCGAEGIATDTPSRIRLYYSSGRQGELEPCDCTHHQNGGLHRLQAFLESERAALPTGTETLFVDAGDSFFSLPSVPETRLRSEAARADVLADAYRLLKLDFFTPGETDFALGVGRLRDLERRTHAQWLSADLVDTSGASLFAPYAIRSFGEVKVGVIGVAEPGAFSPCEKLRVSDPIASVRKALAELEKKKARPIIVLSHSGLKWDRELARQVEGIDAIVGAHSLDALGEPVLVGKTSIVQPVFQGQQIGILEFDRSGAPPKSRVVDLDESWEKNNATKAEIQKYNAWVRELAVEGGSESKKSETPDASTRPYVANAQTCRGCHAKQYDFWESTKHASAYLVLYAKNQHFDPECIGCHSVGFEDPAGFKNIASPVVLAGAPKRKKGELPFVEKMMRTVFESDPGHGPLDSRTQPARYAQLKKRYHEEVGKLSASGKLQALYIGVQCENCHGNRQGHPAPNVATVKKVKEETCRSCHDASHHPEFKSSMVKKVACPLIDRTKRP